MTNIATEINFDEVQKGIDEMIAMGLDLSFLTHDDIDRMTQEFKNVVLNSVYTVMTKYQLTDLKQKAIEECKNKVVLLEEQKKTAEDSLILEKIEGDLKANLFEIDTLTKEIENIGKTVENIPDYVKYVGMMIRGFKKLTDNNATTTTADTTNN